LKYYFHFTFFTQNSFFKNTASVVIVICLLPYMETNSLVPLLYLKNVSIISLVIVVGELKLPIIFIAYPYSVIL